MDHLAINEAFRDLNAAWMHDPSAWAQYCHAFNIAMQATVEEVAERLQQKARQALADNKGIEDQSIMVWINNIAWSSQHYHQVASQWLTDYVLRAPGMESDARRRALFWMHQILEMLAPANFFWTNPKAVRHFLNSKSKSLQQGLCQWLKDIHRSDRLPQMTDPTAFKVGENLAMTPGQVVYRNLLMEVIQYAPQTPSTWQVPMVLIQPWINKYYIFDLTPQNSLVRYLVQQGFTVFVTSWKNPTKEMAHCSFEDYMLHGALQAIVVARQICQIPRVHAAGYCIGGTLLACLSGYLAHEPERHPIADATLFATLIDFTDSGDLKAFVNHTSLKTVEQMVAAEGVLKSQHLSLAFRMLNPGDLIWRRMVTNYFYGESPARSDMLFWNSDGTNMAGAMCLFYLKSFYLENRLSQPNQLILGRRPIDLKQVRLPIYAVGALKDHICPWPATFQACRLTSGPVRYALANEGHITGIVNPPSPWSKKKYWAGAASRRRNPQRWLQDRAPAAGSWWPDWISWLSPRSGRKSTPPPMGSDKYPPLGPAPGIYVHE